MKVSRSVPEQPANNHKKETKVYIWDITLLLMCAHKVEEHTFRVSKAKHLPVPLSCSLKYD